MTDGTDGTSRTTGPAGLEPCSPQLSKLGDFRFTAYQILVIYVSGHRPCFASQSRQASATSRQPLSMVSE